MEIYLSLAEAAELEGMKYNSFVQKIMRRASDENIKREKRADGGRDTTLIALSSLSHSAKMAYRERQKLREMAAGDGTPEDPEETDRPWYTMTDVEWFMEHRKRDWYKAMELSNTVAEFIQLSKKEAWGEKADAAEEFSRERIGKGKRTLYRYQKLYLEASAWADKCHKEDGGNYDFFKILALCRKPKEAGKFPSFTPEVKQAIKNIWFNKEFAANLGTREMLYDKLVKLQKINGWEKIPSYQSVTRYISYLMNDERLKNTWYLASRGEREYKNKIQVKGSRDTKALKVMQIVMGDEHTFDCWVKYTYPNGKVAAIKPHLAAWIDMRSRAIMGDVMCKDANSDILKQSLLKMLYSHPGGVPEYLYIDNGKDYTAEPMTGRPRNKRSDSEVSEAPAASEASMEKYFFDDEAIGFYKSIGIKDDHRALPYQPWSKGQIERFFGTVCSKFTKWMESYTGTLTGSRTFCKIEKDIPTMLKEDRLISIDDFFKLWSKWLSEKYMVHKHRGLKAAGEEWQTPLSCFEHAERYEKPVPAKSYATMLMMKSEHRLVQNIGIRFGGYEYRSDELCNYIGERVDIKYDPADMAVLYVFYKGKKVCEAYSQELLQISPHGVTQDALKEHLARQKKQLKRDRELLKELNTPFEELNEQYVGFNKTTGGIDLMLHKEETESKVIAMPTDRSYREGLRRRRPEPEEEPDDNEYIDRKAEEALRALRAL